MGFNCASIRAPVSISSVFIVALFYSKDNKSISTIWLADFTYVVQIKFRFALSAIVGGSILIVGAGLTVRYGRAVKDTGAVLE
jgi:hypothetical protein